MSFVEKLSSFGLLPFGFTVDCSRRKRQYFNVLLSAQAELMKEGLENLGDIQYTDNEPVLDLFVSKPIGLLSLLDEQCRGLNVSRGGSILRVGREGGR